MWDMLLHRYQGHVAGLSTSTGSDVYGGASGAVAGTVLGLVGWLAYSLAVLGTAYPTQWNVIGTIDYSTIGIIAYGLGLGLIVFHSRGAVSCHLFD